MGSILLQIQILAILVSVCVAVGRIPLQRFRKDPNDALFTLRNARFGNFDTQQKTSDINHSKSRRGKRLRADSRVSQTNNMDYSYHGPVYMGTGDFEARVVYDTGSDWLVVEASSCASCLGTNYDTSTSTSATQVTT